MDRPPRRSALKVQNFRHYHLSGDLEEVVQGKVSKKLTGGRIRVSVAHIWTQWMRRPSMPICRPRSRNRRTRVQECNWRSKI